MSVISSKSTAFALFIAAIVLIGCGGGGGGGSSTGSLSTGTQTSGGGTTTTGTSTTTGGSTGSSSSTTTTGTSGSTGGTTGTTGGTTGTTTGSTGTTGTTGGTTAGSTGGNPIVIGFDEHAAMPSSPITTVPTEARVSTDYLHLGVRFSSSGGFATVVQLRPGEAPSEPNALGGSTSAGILTYTRDDPVVMTFWNPLNPTEKAATRSISVTADKVSVTSQTVRLEAYDANGVLVGSDIAADVGGQTLSISLSSNVIHRVVFYGSEGNNNGVAIDDVTFSPLAPLGT